MEATQLIIDVTAGIIPGQPMSEHTKRWSLTAEQARDLDVLAAAVGHSIVYALSLHDPRALNWVRHEWTWL